MKRKLVKESLIYCILPIIAILCFYSQYRSIPWIILVIGVVYACCTKKKENRINYTFLTFLVLFSTYYIMTNGMKSDVLVQFNLGFVIFISIAVLLLEVMDISICKIAFQDILMMLGESKMGVYKVSKRSKVDLNLKKLSMIIIIELLCCDLIGVYCINIKNMENLNNMIAYVCLTVIVFTLFEIYQINTIKSKVKYVKYKNKNIVKQNVDLGKVINLEQYR